MDLKSMLLPEKTVTFDFPGCPGFTVDLTFLSKERNQQLLKKCMTTKFDSRTRQPKEELDEDLFVQVYTDAILKGWKGLKLKYLKELVLIDVPEEMEDDELAFTSTNAVDLMKSSITFDNWVSDQVGDLGKFTTSNSKSSPKESKVTSKKADQD